MKHSWKLILAIILFATSTQLASSTEPLVQLGPRPFFLVDDMDPSALKDELNACKSGPFTKSDWSIGHRGAAMQFPEHTKESYTAAAQMGAGIIECDVTFTKDKHLICRHSQNDLHTTTNILQTNLASTCKSEFKPALRNKEASAECRASDITLAEFKTLNGKMDFGNRTAKNIDEYVSGTPNWRTNLYASKGTVITHSQSIDLIKSLGSKFMPELKTPAVPMPFDGLTQQMYAQAMIDEYKKAGIPASDVFPQSFNLADVLYWIENESEFGKQAVLLDASYRVPGWSPMKPDTWAYDLSDLKAKGLNYIAPPVWALMTVENGKIVSSSYAKHANDVGLNIISWTVERSGSLKEGGGWYYQSIANLINNDGDVMNMLHALNKEVGIKGVFSDWPATTTYYANCFGLN